MRAPELVLSEMTIVGPDGAEGGVAEWGTNDGVVLHGYRAGSYGWIAAPGVAMYRFSKTGPVVASPDGANPARIESVWLSSVLPLVVQARGMQVLHASAFVAEGRMVALCGASGAGKSTLAAAMELRGHRLAADDALPFGLTPEGPSGTPLPFALRLRPSAAKLLERDERSPPRDAAEAAPLASLVVLEPDPNVVGEPLLEELTEPGTIVGLLLPQLYCFSLENGKEDLVRELFALVDTVPVFRLTYQQSPRVLSDTCDVLEGLLNG